MDSRAPGHEEPLWIALSDGDRVAIQLFPREPSFSRDVGRALKGIEASPASESQALISLRDALRAWYPRLEIQPRNELAGLAPHDRVWYVLRDGRVGRANDQTNRLHAALSKARETSEESDTAVERARAALDFASQPRSRQSREPVTAGVQATERVSGAIDADADDPGEVDGPGAHER